MNEGLTVFLEQKARYILEGNESYKVRNCVLDQGLRECIKQFGVTHSYTSLTPDLGHENPDDAFS